MLDDPTFWIAVYGGALSTIAIGLRFRDYYLDKYSLKINAGAVDLGIAGVGVVKKGQLSLSMSVRGRRPVHVNNVTAVLNKGGKKTTMLLRFPKLPFNVTETTPYRDTLDVLEKVAVPTLESIYAVDALEKKWFIPKKSIKKLRARSKPPKNHKSA